MSRSCPLSHPQQPTETIVVSAAVLQRADERLLVTRRLKGTHLEGLWEFPGGKCEPGETHEAALHREIQEELGVDVTIHGRLLSTRHQYDTRCVELHFFDCRSTGEPQPRLGQEIRWVTRAELAHLAFPAADEELIALLTQSTSSSSRSTPASF